MKEWFACDFLFFWSNHPNSQMDSPEINYLMCSPNILPELFVIQFA